MKKGDTTAGSTSPSSSEEKEIEEKFLVHFSHLDLQTATFHPEWIPLMANDTLTTNLTNFGRQPKQQQL